MFYMENVSSNKKVKRSLREKHMADTLLKLYKQWVDAGRPNVNDQAAFTNGISKPKP